MPDFNYKAKDKKGKIAVGSITAKNKADAQKQVRKMKLKPISIKEDKETFLGKFISTSIDDKGKPTLTLGSGNPPLREIAIFTKQFAIMIERGVPLIQALGIMAQQQKTPKFGQSLAKISKMVENGATLSVAMNQFPKIFDELYCSMIKSGEVSGNLDKVLLELVKFLDKSAKLRAQIKSASIYPLIILVVATSITWGIMVFLVPVFAKQYEEMQQDLPAITQIVVDISDALQAYALHLFGGIVGGIIALSYYRGTPQGKQAIDALLLKMPVTGDVALKVSIGRFTSTMATMMASGVQILEALDICAESSGNKVIEIFVKNIKEKISQGSNFSDPLSEGGLFPPMVVSMVAVGEQTGALDETLIKVSEIYEEEVDNAVKNMTDMFQPILIVGIGGMLGFVVLALYMPIFDQASMATG